MSAYAGRLLKSEWEVRPIPLAVGTAMIERLHYSQGGANTETYLHGLFERTHPARCRGVAWWIPPTKAAARATLRDLGADEADWPGVLALSRLVVDEDVPKNAATFLLARSRQMIDPLQWPCLVTYADEWQGHTGTIYRADNWTYLGKTSPEATFVKDGRMIARKAGPKTRTSEEMKALGAEMIGRFAKHKFARLEGAGKLIRRQSSLEL